MGGLTMRNLDLHRVGERHITCDGYEAEIVRYGGTYDVDIMLSKEYIITVQYGHLIRGKVKNPYHPLLFGVGFIGVGKYKTKTNNLSTKYYITWRNMLERGHSEKYKQKRPNYKDVTVCEEWHCFQNFAKWHEENWKTYMDKWHLDKDILVKGNKLYSPNTCCFVPNEVNSFFVKGKSRRGACLIGVSRGYGKFMASCNTNKKVKNLGYFTTELKAFEVYKIFKENLATELAEKWKSQITEPTYQALINYKVEIDD